LVKFYKLEAKTIMSILNTIIEKAKTTGAKLVFAEGLDPRVIQAAHKIVNDGIAQVTVLGTDSEITQACHLAGVDACNFDVIDPLLSPLVTDFARNFCEIRKAKGMTMDAATAIMHDRLYFANMMCHQGLVDGVVAGSVASTSDMLRASLQVIGTSKGIKTASSSMLLDFTSSSPTGYSSLLFADCAVNPNPDAEQLVDIAIASANTYYTLTGKKPKVAFLSFATHGSAQHESLDKIRQAAALTVSKVEAEGLDIIVDGEIQADAAIVPSIAAKKCPDSALKGTANVLIFPDLNSGNICYKLVQRLSDIAVYGPLLQGLAKPVNDLSRGCSAEDIYGVAAITACQAI
jgi:phosphate acetyltransferase